MKKMILRAAMIVAVFAASTTVADAQLSDLVNKVTSAASSKSSSNGILSTIGSMFSSKLVPNSTQIVGTWVYQQPAIVLTSNNILTTSAGSVASAKIESTLQNYLNQAGIQKGKTSVTFNSDKTFSINYGAKKISGTYVLANNKVSLTFQGMKNPCKLTPQLINGSLVVAADVSSIKSFMENIGSKSGVAYANNIVAVLKQFNGVQVGLRLKKK